MINHRLVVAKAAALTPNAHVFALCKDRSLRFCDEYQNFNAVTKRDFYSIPRIDEFIGSLFLRKVAMFFALNANSSYW